MPHEITLEVLLSKEVCKLLDSFAAAMNIQVVFFSGQGKVLLQEQLALLQFDAGTVFRC